MKQSLGNLPTTLKVAYLKIVAILTMLNNLIYLFLVNCESNMNINYISPRPAIHIS